VKTSEAINEIAAALAKAQGEIRNPEKDQLNPHFKSKYADLAGGLETIRPTLAKHGLSVVQMTECDGEIVTLHSRLMHSSGQWVASTYPVCKLGPHQQMGAAMTYARRYCLFALVGVAGADDEDDGNTAPTARRRPGEKTETERATSSEKAPTAPRDSTPYAERKSSAAVKREDVWPTFERSVREATTTAELTAIWNERSAEFETWPKTWQEQVDELFLNRADDLAGRVEAAE